MGMATSVMTRGPHVEQEEHHDHRHDHAALDQGPPEVADGGLDEGRLAEHVRVELHAGGERLLDLAQHLLHLVGDGQRVGPVELGDGPDHRGLAHVGGVAAGELRSQPDLRDLGERDRRSLAIGHDRPPQVVQRGDPAHAGHRQLLGRTRP